MSMDPGTLYSIDLHHRLFELQLVVFYALLKVRNKEGVNLTEEPEFGCRFLNNFYIY